MPTAAETITERILEVAAKVQRSQSEGHLIEQHRLSELVAALEAVAGVEPDAASQPHFGIRFTQLVPPPGG